MITDQTTSVYVRVDLASHRVIGVSDEALVNRPDQPVFKVDANFSRLDYYVVEKNITTSVGISVRAATADERVAIDSKVAAEVAVITTRTKNQKAFAIKDFYDNIFLKRFITSEFLTIGELHDVILYAGTDTHILTVVQPLAKSVHNAYCEWRHGVCETVIEAMYADNTGVSVELDEKYRTATEDALDAFLIEREFDLGVYHR